MALEQGETLQLGQLKKGTVGLQGTPPKNNPPFEVVKFEASKPTKLGGDGTAVLRHHFSA